MYCWQSIGGPIKAVESVTDSNVFNVAVSVDSNDTTVEDISTVEEQIPMVKVIEQGLPVDMQTEEQLSVVTQELPDGGEVSI